MKSPDSSHLIERVEQLSVCRVVFHLHNNTNILCMYEIRIVDDSTVTCMWIKKMIFTSRLMRKKMFNWAAEH